MPVGAHRASVRSVALVLLGMGCLDAGETSIDPSTLPELHVTGQVTGNQRFRISSATATDSCGIVVVGRDWGTAVSVMPENPNGGAGTVTRLPGYPEGANVARSGNHEVVYWYEEPEGWGMVLGGDDARPFSPPEHPWGGLAIGPVVPLSAGRFAMAIFGGTKGRRMPEKSSHTPLVLIVDSSGESIGRVGELKSGRGHYRPSLMAKSIVGAVGDTVLVLTFQDATLTAYDVTAGGTADRALWSEELPRYISTSDPREEVMDAPWVVNAPWSVVSLPQVTVAAFDRFGNVYAIRPTSRRRTIGGGGGFEIKRQWVGANHILEMFDLRGRVKGRYRLPSGLLGWLNVAPNGRIFLLTATDSLTATNSLLLVDNPLLPDQCSGVPETVHILSHDTPPAEGYNSSAFRDRETRLTRSLVPVPR